MIMSIAIISPGRDPKAWIAALQHHHPDLDLQIFPHIDRPEDVEMALLWQHPPGYLKNFPNLKLISSLGAGVDHILSDPAVGDELPIVRIVEKSDEPPQLNLCPLILQPLDSDFHLVRVRW